MQRLSPLKILAYSCGNLAAGLYYAFNSFTLPLFLSLYTQNAILIGWLSSTRSFEQFVVQPIVGAASDRTWTRIGRRAPFFVLAMPISALILAITGNLPEAPEFLLFDVIGVFVFSFIFNIGIDPYVALLADVAPSEQRGTINGIAAVFGFIGQVILLIAAAFFFEAHHEWVFYLVAVGLVVGFGIVAFGVREKKRTAEHEPKGTRPLFRGWRRYGRERWHEDPDAVKLLGVKFLYQFGINAAVPFLTLFVVTEIGTVGWREILGTIPSLASLGDMNATGVSQLMGVVLLLSTAIFAFPIGLLGDRLGKRKVFGAGLLIMGIFGLLASFAQSIPQLMFYLILIGLGNAAQTVLFFPYLADLIDADRAGEFQGLSAAAETGGVFLSILVAGELINLNLFGLHYRLVFILTGIFLIVGFLAVLFVRETRGQPRSEVMVVESVAS